MTVVCKCQSCGFEFIQSQLFGGSAKVTITGSGTNCIKCGGFAAILDGTYTIQNSTLLAVEGPDITVQVALRLGAIWEKVKEDADISVSEILSEIAGVSPELAAKIGKKGFGVFGILMLLFWLIKSVQLNLTLDINKLIDQAQGYEQNQEMLQQPEDIPIPEDAIINEPTPPTIAAGSISSTPNRKERRRQVSLAKKRVKGRA